MATVRKVKTKEFAKMEGISTDAALRRLKKFPQLKCADPGGRGYRVDLNEWDKILKTA